MNGGIPGGTPPRRKTTNRLRAIETLITTSPSEPGIGVARPLIAFGRLKHLTRGHQPSILTVCRKTTNRLRAIETQYSVPTQDGKLKVARPLIAFGRLKLSYPPHLQCDQRLVARPLIAFGRLKRIQGVAEQLAELGRKTTNRLRAIETPCRTSIPSLRKTSQDH